MKKFLAVYIAPVTALEEMMKNSTPEQREAGKAEWTKWMEDNKANIADMGGPLGKTKRVTKDGATDTRNEMMGYSIIQAESAEAAAKLFEGNHPQWQFAGSSVDIMEIVTM
jgi:hypothetical protein